MEQVLQQQDVDEGLRQQGQNVVQKFASWLNANVAPARVIAEVKDFYPGFDPRGAFSWLEEPAQQHGFFLLVVPVVKRVKIKNEGEGEVTFQTLHCVLLSAKERLSEDEMAATLAGSKSESESSPLNDTAQKGTGADTEAATSSSKHPRQHATDEELRALTAAFTEMASSAGRVAQSLSRINSLAEEIHSELRATHEALAVPRRLSAEEGIRR